MQEEKLGIKLTTIQEKEIAQYIGTLNVKFLKDTSETDYYAYYFSVDPEIIVGDDVYHMIKNFTSDVPEIRPCNCSISVLMVKGCQCGGV